MSGRDLWASPTASERFSQSQKHITENKKNLRWNGQSLPAKRLITLMDANDLKMEELYKIFLVTIVIDLLRVKIS